MMKTAKPAEVKSNESTMRELGKTSPAVGKQAIFKFDLEISNEIVGRLWESLYKLSKKKDENFRVICGF